MDTALLTSLQQGLDDLKQASDDSKAVQAVQAKLTSDMSQQLAKLCQSVNAIQAKLYNATDSAVPGAAIKACQSIQHRQQCARISDD
jgi:hypothetical protein